MAAERDPLRALGVRCKCCGEAFRTALLFGVYGRPVVGAAAWPCPSCKRRATYANEDYFPILAPPEKARA